MPAEKIRASPYFPKPNMTNDRFWRKAAARFECDRRDDAVAIIFMNMIDKSMRL